MVVGHGVPADRAGSLVPWDIPAAPLPPQGWSAMAELRRTVSAGPPFAAADLYAQPHTAANAGRDTRRHSRRRGDRMAPSPTAAAFVGCARGGRACAIRGAFMGLGR